jgi:hypothetical protein
VTRFEAVEIVPAGTHYQLLQLGGLLLSIPRGVFDAYEPDTVFPPQWRPRVSSFPRRQLFWNPTTREFLMAGLDSRPARIVESFGSNPYRSFLQAVWIPAPPAVLTRPFWNPSDPYEPFDVPARTLSMRTQLSFRETLARLRPPEGCAWVLNATDPYLEAHGAGTGDPAPDADIVREVTLTPPLDLRAPEATTALEALATQHVGAVFPVLRGNRFAAVQALSLSNLHVAAALLEEQGIEYHEGEFWPQ